MIFSLIYLTSYINGFYWARIVITMSYCISMQGTLRNGNGNVFFDFIIGFMTCILVLYTTLKCSRAFWDKRISQEVLGDALGEVWSLGGIRTFNVSWNFLRNFDETDWPLHFYNSAANRNSKAMSSKSLEVMTNEDFQWSRECSPLGVFVSCSTEVGLF